MKRVVITGAGTVNALAMDAAGTYAAFREGRSGITDLVFRGTERLSVTIGAQVHRWAPEALYSRQQISLYDRFTQFALKAANEAVKQAGIDFEGDLGLRSGVILGTAGGGVETWDDSYHGIYHEKRNRVHPLVVPRLMHNAAAAHVSMTWGIKGPSFTVSSACASANHAMGLAFQMVRSGAAPVMITGGAESMLNFGGIKAWEGLKVLSKTGCRPFSADRDGMVQGEGAGVFVFEDYEHARARGATILAEVAGFGMTSDARDVVTPSTDGAIRAIKACLADAKLRPDQIGYINAHGTGTTINDRSECLAIKRSFGPAAEKVMVSSTKSMHGHAIGATGALEMFACLMALRDGVIAPTAGYTTPDPACALDVVPNTAREAKVDAVISNAFAFGGMNAVLALKRI